MKGKRDKKAVAKRERDAEERLARGETVLQIIEAQRAAGGMALSRSRLYVLQKNVRSGTRLYPPRTKREPRAASPQPVALDLGLLVSALGSLPPGQFRMKRPDGYTVEIDVIGPA